MRVYVTGMGAITAGGNDLMSSWQAVQQGTSGISKITQWDIAEWEYPLGGEIKDYDPRNMVSDRKLLKLLSRHDLIGLNAATQAVKHSNLLEYRETLTDPSQFNDRTAIYVGSPGNKYFQQYDFIPLLDYAHDDMHKFADKLFEKVHPMWLLKILPNNVLAYTGMQFGFKGPNQNITNHAVSGSQAIIEAYYAIKTGQADRAVVVAYDLGFEPQSVLYYGNAGLLSNSAIKSFDTSRDGTILAEGAGALVLESEAAAQQRNAKCYVEILGGTSSCEAEGIFSLHEQGDYLADTIQKALNLAEITASDVGMITAHANGNIKSDASEASAIRQIFGDEKVPVTAFKWAVGHSLTAAGVIENLLTIMALNNGIVPGIETLNNVANDCAGIAVSHSAQPTKSAIGLVINRGFASLNSCVLIRSCADE